MRAFRHGKDSHYIFPLIYLQPTFTLHRRKSADSLASMSLTTIGQFSLCIVGKLFDKHNTICLARHSRSHHHTTTRFGVHWKICNLAVTKRNTHMFFWGGFKSSPSKPQVWDACTLHHPRWTPYVCVCVCECGLHECMHPEYACRQPSQLCTSASCCSKSPCISNAVFCPSSLLASAGARKVVIFFKVCIDTHLWKGQ